jgi:hypothetical protein
MWNATDTLHPANAQPPSDDSEPTLTKIYDVYRTPAGHIEGEEDIAEILEGDAAGLPKFGMRPNKRSNMRRS